MNAILIDEARGVYDERAFDRMPIPADALQDAGCDSDNIPTHAATPAEFTSAGAG